LILGGNLFQFSTHLYIKHMLKNSNYIQMCHYCVNSIAQETGEHEVHKEDCKHSPNMVFKKYLGYFSNCSIAIEEAKKIYPKSKGCKYCCGVTMLVETKKLV